MDKLVTDLRAQLIPAKLQRRIVGIDVAADSTRGLGVVSASEDAAPLLLPRTRCTKRQLNRLAR